MLDANPMFASDWKYIAIVYELVHIQYAGLDERRGDEKFDRYSFD
jgi:hypothetical protein